MKSKFFILILLILGACNDSEKAASQSLKNFNDLAKKRSEYIEALCTLKLPDKLVFCGETVPLDIPEVRERAEREFYMLLQQPGQIILYIKRAGRYFPMFVEKLKAAGLPEDIKYVSVAESALYMARSAKEAVGLWQFIASTGKNMGLQIDDNIDERRHPGKSTDAAIKYLKEGYSVHKSWTLTAAGYNMGHENVQENLRYQTVDDYFELFLNEETSRYIFRIIIIKEIMENPLKYGFDISENEIYKPEKTKKIECGSAVANLAEWAVKHGCTYKDVKILNPWILKRSLPQPPKGREYEIEVPDN